MHAETLKGKSHSKTVVSFNLSSLHHCFVLDSPYTHPIRGYFDN